MFRSAAAAFWIAMYLVSSPVRPDSSGAATNPPEKRSGEDRDQQEIGITISDPKVYEERTLRAMLAEAEAQLAALRPIGGTKVDAAIGSLQGASQSHSAFTLSAGSLATPALDSYVEQGLVGGELQTTKTTETTKYAQDSVPAPPAPPTTALGTTGYGLSARDLLSEQMALAYQAFSLRLALERAASDRVNSLEACVQSTEHGALPSTVCSSEAVPRKAIVLGFTIGIDRPIPKSVAEVEVSLTLRGIETKRPHGRVQTEIKSPPGISLVSVLPTKEAYNVAAITDKSVGIGAGQVVGAFELGAGWFGGKKTHYVVRDVDTISTTKRSSEQNTVRVAWQFRPVLGRKLVEPGPRQVWVVLAVDSTRYEQNGFGLDAKARLSWSSINRRGVLGKESVEKEENFQSLGYWSVFTDEMLEPFPAEPVLTVLSPVLGLVSVKGHFLSQETRVLVGDAAIDRTNGLSFSDESGLSFSAKLIDLARADQILLVNRFLRPHEVIVRFWDGDTPVERPLEFDPISCSPGEARANCCFARNAGEDRYRVRTCLKGEPVVERLLGLAADKVVAGAAPAREPASQIRRLRGADNSCPSGSDPVELELPVDAVRKGTDLLIREVFGGRDRAVRCELPSLPSVDKVSTLIEEKDHVTLALQGKGLKSLKRARLGEETVSFLPHSTKDVALLKIEKPKVPKNLLLLETAEGDLLLVPMEKPKAPVKEPTVTGALEVARHFSGPLVVKGDDFDSIERVLFEDSELKSRVKGNELTIFLTSKVTEHPAIRHLTLRLTDGKEVTVAIVVKG